MKVLYVKNGSDRDIKFQLQTLIYEENGKKYVKKSVLCDEALPQLLDMHENYTKLSNLIINPKVKLAEIIDKDERSLTFEYIAGESLANRLQKISSDEEKIRKFIEEYSDFLKNSFKTSTFDAKNMTNECKEVFGDFDYSVFDGELCFDGVSNIDLIFSNIIYKDDEIYIIDYEWVFVHSLPIEYVLYRTLKYKNLLDGYSYLEKYEDLEAFFISKYVYDQSFHKYNLQYGKKRNIVEEVIGEREKQIQEKNQQIQEKDQQIREKKQQIQEKDQQIQEKEQQTLRQKQEIVKLTESNIQLQEITQSMRIKNRIKNLFQFRKSRTL